MLGFLMTTCAVYIGDLNDPSFDWDGDDDATSIPSGLSPEFPPNKEPLLGCFHEWVERSGVECKLTWHEVWVARVTKAQIHDYIEYCYGSDPSYNDPDKWLTWEGRPYLVDRLDAVKEFVAGLDRQEQYALVAMEIY
jgi:hypothetical protein